MTITKYIVLLCGLAGLGAFFLPLVHVEHKGFRGTASAFDVAWGLEATQTGARGVRELGESVELGEVSDQAREVEEMSTVALALLLVPFAISGLFAVFGLLGALKGSFGRGLGLGTLVLGLAGLGLAALLYSKAGEHHVQEGLGSGFYVLAASYAGAAVFGLLAVLAPD